jgi:BON domain-containing protein
MMKTIRTITIIGCLMLPLVSFGAGDPKGDRGAKFDRDLAAKIHKSLAKDDSLKAYVSAVNVDVKDGQVTLKGTVQSDEQSQDIQAKAESETIQVTPIDQIDMVAVHNELTVSSK